MFSAPSRLAIFIALAGAAMAPLPAFAAAASVAQNVNLRSGPGATYGVVTQLQRGDVVDISKCQGLFCYVSIGGKVGWVSAAYLTRDNVPKSPGNLIPETQIATGAAGRPGSPSAPARPASPEVATADPRLAPRGDYPEAFGPGDTADPGGDPIRPAPDERDYASGGYDGPALPYEGGSGSQVTLPPDAGGVIAGTNVERPKADIPDGPRDAYDNGDAPDVGPLATDDWNPGPSVRWQEYDDPRGRFAALDGGPRRARACFFGDGPDGGRFCLGAGQSREQFGNWGYHISAIQNPMGLRVTLCTTDNGCRVYESSGPVMLPPDASIASIRVAPPPGY